MFDLDFYVSQTLPTIHLPQDQFSPSLSPSRLSYSSNYYRIITSSPKKKMRVSFTLALLAFIGLASANLRGLQDQQVAAAPAQADPKVRFLSLCLLV